MKIIKHLKKFSSLCESYGFSLSLVLKEIREEFELSQDELEIFLNVSKSTISTIENNRNTEIEKYFRNILVLYLCLHETKKNGTIFEALKKFEPFEKLYKKSKKTNTSILKLFRDESSMSQQDVEKISKLNRNILSSLETDKVPFEKYLFQIWLIIVMFKDIKIRKIVELLEVKVRDNTEQEDILKKIKNEPIKDNLSKVPLYKLYEVVNTNLLTNHDITDIKDQKEILDEVKVQKNQTIKYIKLLYKNLLKNRKFDISQGMWHNIQIARMSDKKENERYFKALANFLLVWDKTYGNKRFNKSTAKFIEIYINKILSDCFEKRPYPNQIFCDYTFETWNKYWEEQEIDFNDTKKRFRDVTPKQRPLTELEQLCLDKFGYKNSSEIHNAYIFSLNIKEKEKLEELFIPILEFEKNYTKNLTDQRKKQDILETTIIHDLVVDNNYNIAVRFAKKMFYKQKKSLEEIYEYFDSRGHSLRFSPAIIDFWHSKEFDTNNFVNWLPAIKEVKKIYKGYLITLGEKQGDYIIEKRKTDLQKSIINLDDEINKFFIQDIHQRSSEYIYKRKEQELRFNSNVIKNIEESIH